MKRTLIVECLALVAIGALGLVGGIGAYLRADARTQSSLMQPGVYVTAIAAALVVTALVYGFLGLRRLRKPGSNVEPEQEEGNARAVWMVYAGVVLYGVLISIAGYVIATVLFLAAQFRILGVASWPRIAVLTAIVTVVFYVLFVHYGEMVFPRGVFGE